LHACRGDTFLYQSADRPWSEFKRENGAALQELVRNASTPGTLLYDTDVAAAVKSGGANAGLATLERKWSEEHSRVQAARNDAVALAELSRRWQWWNGADNMANDMATVFERYPNQNQRQYLYDLVDDFGGNPQVIQDLSRRHTNAGVRLWRQVRRLDTGASK
jgi:hypothetical protein